MGSCFSKASTKDAGQPLHEKQRSERISERPSRKPHSRGLNPSTNENRLGGQDRNNSSTSNNDGSREAAANAAELRYKKQQENLKTSMSKLKAMEKTSKKDKGLA